MEAIRYLSFVPKVLLLVISFSCQQKSGLKSPPPAVEVTTCVVEPKTIPIDFSFVGVVQSSHHVNIRSAVQGELQKIAYIEGSYVNKGDLLFQIDPRHYETLVEVAQANLQSELAALTQAQKTVDRLVPLYAEHAVSQKDLDDAEGGLLIAHANVSKCQAQLDEANLNLALTSITAPISGFTSLAQYQEGSLILPDTNKNLATVSALDPIYVELNSSEGLYLTNIEEVAKGELILPENGDFDVTLQLSNGSEFPIVGKVSFVSPVFNLDTGTLITRAVFSNPNNALRPGLFVTATAHGSFRPNAIIVPPEAVQQGAVGYFVYVVDEERQAEIRPVIVGEWYKEFWIIKSGLKKGDQVIVNGTLKVQNGTPIKVKKK